MTSNTAGPACGHGAGSARICCSSATPASSSAMSRNAAANGRCSNCAVACSTVVTACAAKPKRSSSTHSKVLATPSASSTSASRSGSAAPGSVRSLASRARRALARAAAFAALCGGGGPATGGITAAASIGACGSETMSISVGRSRSTPGWVGSSRWAWRAVSSSSVRRMRVGSIGRRRCRPAPIGASVPTKTACATRPDCTTPLTAGWESASTTAKSASDSASTRSYSDSRNPLGC